MFSIVKPLRLTALTHALSRLSVSSFSCSRIWGNLNNLYPSSPCFTVHPRATHWFGIPIVWNAATWFYVSIMFLSKPSSDTKVKLTVKHRKRFYHRRQMMWQTAGSSNVFELFYVTELRKAIPTTLSLFNVYLNLAFVVVSERVRLRPLEWKLRPYTSP